MGSYFPFRTLLKNGILLSVQDSPKNEILLYVQDPPEKKMGFYFCSEPSISDLKGEIAGLKGEIKNLKIRLDQVELNILTDQIVKSALPSEKAPDSPRYLTISPTDHLKGPDLFPGEDVPSSSGAISAIKAYSEHIVVKIVVDKDFVLNRVALCRTTPRGVRGSNDTLLKKMVNFCFADFHHFLIHLDWSGFRRNMLFIEARNYSGL